MKKLVIACENGTNPKFKKWAKEASIELLSLFPEYKNSFKIEFRDDAHAAGKEISQAEYDSLPDNGEKLQFVKTPNGGWLVPHKSMEWYLSQARKPAERAGRNETDVSILLGLERENIAKNNSDELIFNLAQGPFNPSCYGYGVEGTGIAVSTSHPNCQEEEFFKTIVMHEFGHVLRATHRSRENTHYDRDLGSHCTNNDCIMGESDYERLSQERLQRKANGQPPFCNECIASMREYLERMPGLVREVQIEQFYETLPKQPHNDDEWKREFRNFYQQVAENRSFQYDEKTEAHNFLLSLNKKDGTFLDVEANNEYNIAICGRNKQGVKKVPSLDDMCDLVKLTQSKNSIIDFGPKNSPEFNARLMIACLEVNMQTDKAPEINNEFLSKLEPATRTHLEALLHNNTPDRRLPQNMVVSMAKNSQNCH